jgi:membrane protein YqaA with SNARE-associated domain
VIKIPIYKRRAFYVFLGILLVISLLSLTIGRDLYLGRPSNIFSFAIIHFAGYLFFLVMPVEAAFIYFITLNKNPFILISIAVITALLAQIIDYYCGHLISKKILEKLVRREKYERGMQYIRKYGNATILFFNLLPLSSPLLILTAGMIKYPLKHVILFSFIGLVIKYLIIVLFFLD